MRLNFLPLVMGLILATNQTAQANYGCLNVDNWIDSQGRYDLTTGRYMELSGQGNWDWATSPDGLYKINNNNQGQLVIAAKTKNPFLTVDISGFSNPINPHWSPDSRYLMLIAASTDNQTLLMVISIANKTIKQFTIPDVDQYGSWAVWSPDSRYVAITSNAQPFPSYTVSISLYGIDGSMLPDVIKNAAGILNCGADYCDGHDPYTWSADGRTIYFVQNAPDQRFNAFAYNLTTHQTQLLAKNITDFPIYRSDSRYALIQWSEQNTTYAGILNIATKKTLPLDSNTTPADLQWLGDKALVRWDHSFIWADADGTAKHELNLSPEKLVNGPTTTQRPGAGQYGWTTDGHWLIITTVLQDDVRDSEYIWLINLINGKTTTFANMEVAQASDGQFISPDNKIAVLRNNYHDTLYLLNLTDGTLHKANIDPSDLIGVHQIVWIPQSDVIVLVPSGDFYPVYLIRRDGTQIAHYKNFPDLGDPPYFHVNWMPCATATP